MLFIDKYNIDTLSDVHYNHKYYDLIDSLADNNEIPHMIITGNLGIGKKSLVNYYIKKKYKLDKIKTNMRSLAIKCSNKEIDFHFLCSNYHYLLDPSKYGVYDKQILQYLLHDILKYRPINMVSFHLIVIDNADKLTIEAQQSLRRTLEKLIVNCRFIFLTNSNTSMIEPIRSRSLIIKLAAPNKDQIIEILNKILNAEQIKFSNQTLYRIASSVNYNLKECINLCQLLSTIKIDLTDCKVVSEHLYLSDNCFIITNLLLKNAKIDIDMSDLILELRQLIQSMLIECIDPIYTVKKIFLYLFDYFSSRNNDIICQHLIKYTNQYINGIKNCNKPIYYIEGYCLNVYNLLYTLTLDIDTPRSH